jgi:hypothetical protein
MTTANGSSPNKVISYGNVLYDVSKDSAARTNAAGNLYSTKQGGKS